MGEPLIIRQDQCRVVYRVGDEVHKKRLVGLEYEYAIGQYINTLNSSSYVRTLGYRNGRLTTKYVPGYSWHQSLDSSTSLVQSTVQALNILSLLEYLPFTHYDLHMGNVLFPLETQPCIIDMGCAAIPTPTGIAYCEASYPALSCGIFPSVLDPDYDRMLFLLAMRRQAHHFHLPELTSFCQQALAAAHFDNPLFYGYEDFLPLDVIQRYRVLFYKDRQPLLTYSANTTTCSREELLSGLDVLQTKALSSSQPLDEWRHENEGRIYGLLHNYKRHRIANRVTPSFASIRTAVLSSSQ